MPNTDTTLPSQYEPHTLEAALQRQWIEHGTYLSVENHNKPKYYCVSMLPYPSGRLHMGHVRNYTINDVMVRQKRMQGWNVLMPMGWDAFGMPAENAAMANHVPPATWTYQNIDSMKAQMQALGLAIDWSREITTCKPDYYRWNQWLFTRLLEKGLVYKKLGTVNWDPIDKTVLANEQVIDGRGWRSGALVEKRDIPMYYLKITAYADELIADLAKVDWPERVKTMQDHWIGRSVGVRFAFTHTIRDSQDKPILDGKLYVFTTRADTIMGVTFCAVAPEHPLAQHAADANPGVAAFISECQQGGVAEADLATMEKRGIDTGLTVTHPLTGKSVPVWVGNYVLMSYGDGAVMGVPAHDERDFAFAKRYQLAIRQVISWPNKSFSDDIWQNHYALPGTCCDSDSYNGLSQAEAISAIADRLTALGLGEQHVQYRLRDWGISRQRYWGTPIPIIHCEDCGDVPVPDEQLPVILPEDLVPDGSGNPLQHCASFIACTCPRCGKPARRETDTMDTFVDSSWYFLRYACPDADTMVDERVAYWLPMDQYIGGIEHAILHLLYARFWTKVMRDLGLIAFGEPANCLLTQGMVLNDTYFIEEENGQRTWLAPGEVLVIHDDKGRPERAERLSDQASVRIGGIEKMSKSKRNGVDPDDIIQQFGADTARLFTMFAAPPEQSLEWSNTGVEGAFRYLKRLYGFALKHKDVIRSVQAIDLNNGEFSDLRHDIHACLKQADFDYQRRQYNTIVSAGMKMLNAMEAQTSCKPEALHEAMSILLRVLYPIVPHITWALWEALGLNQSTGSNIADAPWPKVDETALVKQQLTLTLQINGKLRGTLELPATADKAELEAAALAHPQTTKFTEGMTIKKIIVVPGRLINIVCGA